MVCKLLINFNLYFYRDRRKNDLEARLGSKEDAGLKYKSSDMKDMEKKKNYAWVQLHDKQ